jgi:hypothetical protein
MSRQKPCDRLIPVQRALQNVYRIKILKKRPRPFKMSVEPLGIMMLILLLLLLLLLLIIIIIET